MHNKSLLIGALCAAASLSGAAVIDFEDLADSSGWAAGVASGYTSQGFVFTTPGSFAVWSTNNSSGYYPGSTALFCDNPNGVITLARSDSAAFDMASIELCNVYRDATSQTITFTGTRADTSTVTNSFTLTDPANLNTFAFTGMTNIVKLEWAQFSPYHQFDNVTASVVPEPASMAALAIGALALLRRRK